MDLGAGVAESDPEAAVAVDPAAEFRVGVAAGVGVDEGGRVVAGRDGELVVEVAAGAFEGAAVGALREVVDEQAAAEEMAGLVQLGGKPGQRGVFGDGSPPTPDKPPDSTTVAPVFHVACHVNYRLRLGQRSSDHRRATWFRLGGPFRAGARLAVSLLMRTGPRAYKRTRIGVVREATRTRPAGPESSDSRYRAEGGDNSMHRRTDWNLHGPLRNEPQRTSGTTRPRPRYDLPALRPLGPLTLSWQELGLMARMTGSHRSALRRAVHMAATVQRQIDFHRSLAARIQEDSRLFDHFARRSRSI